MKLKKILILLMILSGSVIAQEILTGVVKEKDDKGNLKPLIGANIIWQSTSRGTTTDNDGAFELAITKESNLLIVSFIGYKTEKITVTDQREIEVVLEPESKELTDVEVVGEQNSSFQDYKGIENTTIITKKELQKAACCTLAESFETNPSIDVSFTDAITGVRQIEMLGLAGIYSQTTMEALPYIRGLMSNVGLFFVPGTWINSINVSKGIGSVSNGFESITGQIDIDMQKPFNDEEENPGFVNVYGDNDQRFEGNLNYRYKLNDNLSSMTLLHASSRQHRKDINSDSFMDMPTFQTFNIMQRWQYLSYEGWESQFGFQIVNDKKEGGTTDHEAASSPIYKFGSTNKLFSIYGKTGYIFPEEEGRSFGLQWSYSNYNNSSHFGNKMYDGKEKNIYLNFIYQSHLWNESHLFRTGVSFVYDDFNEEFNGTKYTRIEKIPGAFVEYTYKPNTELSVVAGFRADNHNQFGMFFTPRIHIRYSPDEDWVFRAAAGRGYRSSNIFVEYASNFASARSLTIVPVNNFGYGLEQESAWNYGLNVTYYFLYEYRDATLSLDLYRTNFDKVNIADIDSDPRKITLRSVNDGAHSTSFQAELNIEPLQFLSTRLAYRYIDARQLINGSWMDKPFSAKHRVLFNLGYSTERETLDDSQMLYDLTVQWFGSKRIPSTSSNPAGLQSRVISPSFFLVNAQVTRSFGSLFDFYIGIENLFDFRQTDPIIDPGNPNGPYFDASLIWGPISGRMVYAGLRFKI
jgi:outer membrane receptor for ferrienterochelin and colicin